jgi:hypothetical protein
MEDQSLLYLKPPRALPNLDSPRHSITRPMTVFDMYSINLDTPDREIASNLFDHDKRKRLSSETFMKKRVTKAYKLPSASRPPISSLSKADPNYRSLQKCLFFIYYLFH